MFRPEARSKKHVVGPFDKDKLYELEELTSVLNQLPVNSQFSQQSVTIGAK